jgi:integrase
MRIPDTAHTSRPWRIHEIAHDFRLEDVWALPTPGGPDDFPRLVRQTATRDGSTPQSPAARALFAIRSRLGTVLGWDDPDSAVGTRVPTLRDRLPADLRDAPTGPAFEALPFTPRRAAAEAVGRLRTPDSAAVAGRVLTVSGWLEHWLATRASQRASTLRGYRSHVRVYLTPYLGRIPLGELTVGQVQAMFTVLGRDGGPSTAASLARIRATLRTALNAALRHGLIAVNPACRVELPPARRPKAVVWTLTRIEEWRRTGVRPPVAVWTAGQTGQFLQAIRTHRLYAAYHLIALRGLRRGEAAGLRWCDIDLDTGVATISQQLQQYDGHMVIGPPKTARSERTIALDRTTVAALRRHRQQQALERIDGGPSYQDSGFVFTGLRGDPMAPDRLTRTFRRLTVETGLPPIRLHDLRHGAATLALAAGVDLRVVQDMLGHCSIVLTADTYTSVLPDVARKAAEQVAALVLRAGRLVPGTNRPRRPIRQQRPPRSAAVPARSQSRAHPARQVRRPNKTTALPAAA